MKRKQTNKENKNLLNEIDQQIKNKKLQLNEVKGTDTEVYTRIVGYYRQVTNFNEGQAAQRKARKVFKLGIMK